MWCYWFEYGRLSYWHNVFLLMPGCLFDPPDASGVLFSIIISWFVIFLVLHSKLIALCIWVLYLCWCHPFQTGLLFSSIILCLLRFFFSNTFAEILCRYIAITPFTQHPVISMQSSCYFCSFVCSLKSTFGSGIAFADFLFGAAVLGTYLLETSFLLGGLRLSMCEFFHVSELNARRLWRKMWLGSCIPR